MGSDVPRKGVRGGTLEDTSKIRSATAPEKSRYRPPLPPSDRIDGRRYIVGLTVMCRIKHVSVDNEGCTYLSNTQPRRDINNVGLLHDEREN